MYSPTLGRWMQQDPMGYTESSSLYQFGRSSPEDKVDPRWLQATLPDPSATRPATSPATSPANQRDTAQGRRRT